MANFEYDKPKDSPTIHINQKIFKIMSLSHAIFKLNKKQMQSKNRKRSQEPSKINLLKFLNEWNYS